MFKYKIHIPRVLYASLVALVLVLFSNVANAQHYDTISKDLGKKNIRKSLIESDSILKSTKFNSHAKLKHNIRNKNVVDEPISIVRKPHSPQKALLLSLLPGAGQIYNHQAWKIPIIYVALGTVGYFVYDNYTQMKAFKDEYLFRVNNPGSVSLEGYESYPDASIYNLYQSYNQNFQLMIIISAGVYALNLIDAFVFGHLFDFQVNDDLAISVFPQMQSSQYSSSIVPTLGFSFRF